MIDYSTCSHSTYYYEPRIAGRGGYFACEDCDMLAPVVWESEDGESQGRVPDWDNAESW